MQQFTIRDIQHLTGIKAHTLRIWEQRYQFFKSKRKESLHRIYDNDDLKTLLNIALLYHSGMKVSKFDSLSHAEILKLVDSLRPAPAQYEIFIVRMIQAALDFNEQEFSGKLNEVTQILGFEKTVLEVCYPFLVRVGLLWSTNNAIPAQEHFSSYLIQRRIIAETDRLTVQANPSRMILLFTPEGERHEMPLLFINYLLKKTGWGTIYMGVAKKLDLIREIVNARQVTHLYIHLLTNLTGFEVDDYLERVCTTFPELKILASGTAINSAQRNFLNLTCLKSDEAIKSFIGITI